MVTHHQLGVPYIKLLMDFPTDTMLWRKISVSLYMPAKEHPLLFWTPPRFLFWFPTRQPPKNTRNFFGYGLQITCASQVQQGGSRASSGYAKFQLDREPVRRAGSQQHWYSAWRNEVLFSPNSQQRKQTLVSIARSAAMHFSNTLRWNKKGIFQKALQQDFQANGSEGLTGQFLHTCHLMAQRAQGYQTREEEKDLRTKPYGTKDDRSLPSLGTWKLLIWVNFKEKVCPQPQK